MNNPKSPFRKRIHSELSVKPDEILAEEAGSNPSAFAEIYRRHVTNVYRYLFSRVENVDDAQDLTTQTFLAAKESIANYQRRGSFAAWLMGIARHKATDSFRKRKSPLPLTLVEQISSPESSVEEKIDRQFRLEIIARSLKNLTPERAEAISLRIFAGLSTVEVAQVMNKTEASVKMLVHRAVKDLHQYLAIDTSKE